MYTVKDNPYSANGFRARYINELDAGFFYENKQGKRYLVLGTKSKKDNYGCQSFGRIMFALDNPHELCDEMVKYELRLLPRFEEITFVQNEPIPF